MTSRPAPITDSPLFWVLLFGSVGLVMLAAIEPKYIKRQERIERMQQSRQRAQAAQVASPRVSERELEAGSAERSTPVWRPTQSATLRPLMLFLAAVLLAALVVMHLRRHKAISQYRQALATLEEGTRS
ncbi:MAG TPA: hypothetical protein VG125_08215 [Pirellulales bacterium]|jgi:Flp pilus assembly protein TadB|nr:hypothetical protein [Pirellulales bacterium]